MSTGQSKIYQRKVGADLARMVGEYLFAPGGPLHDMPDREVQERTGAFRASTRNQLTDNPWWIDIPNLVQASSLELGITLRGSDGSEVTFYPAQNFHNMPGMPSESKVKTPSLAQGSKTR